MIGLEMVSHVWYRRCLDTFINCFPMYGTGDVLIRLEMVSHVWYTGDVLIRLEMVSLCMVPEMS